MSRPQVLGIYRTKDDADKAALDRYYKRLRAQVAYVGEHSPDPERPWGLIVPPAEPKANGHSKSGP